MSGYRHFAGLKGSKLITVGADETVYNYTDLPSAVAAAQNNDVILMEPGTYTLSEKLTINKPLTIKGMCDVGMFSNPRGVIITGPNDIDTALIDIELVAQGAAARVNFEDIHIVQATDDEDVISINNTTVDQKLYVFFKGCNVLSFDSASTGKGLVILGADATKAIHVGLVGYGWRNRVDYVHFTFKNAGSMLSMEGMVIDDVGGATAIVTSADNLAAQINLNNCLGPVLKFLSGGHGTQVVRTIDNVTVDGTTYAAASTAAFVGDHTEQIIN